jgi:hypothetical protein
MISALVFAGHSEMQKIVRPGVIGRKFSFEGADRVTFGDY